MRCVYRGEQAKVIYHNNRIISTYICSNNEVPERRCIIDSQLDKYASCLECKNRLERFPELELAYDKDAWQYITVARLNSDTLRLLSVIPPNCAGIVGIPRSGMVPASLLASMTQLPLYELSVQKGLCMLGQGSRTWISPQRDRSGPYFVVDDSIYSGNAMALAKAAFHNNAVFAVVYVMPELRQMVDYYVREIPSPHFFEWNLFNNGMIGGYSMDPRLRGGIALDLDGVICFDPPMPDADDGVIYESYAKWLDVAPPKYIPRYTAVPCIITFRLEKWRSKTIQWLKKYNVKWERLIMSPHTSVIRRNSELDIAGHKARNFVESGCSMMIESDPHQAELIHRISRRPVLCPDSAVLHQDLCDWEALSRLDRFRVHESRSTKAC